MEELTTPATSIQLVYKEANSDYKLITTVFSKIAIPLRNAPSIFTQHDCCQTQTQKFVPSPYL
jgi:hypothetical protein